MIPPIDLHQARTKDTRKYRRQQGEKTRETEMARAEAADLAVQLRKVCGHEVHAR